MKKCISCSKDIPDTAAHCVFCGSKQGAAQPVAAGPQKTMMGYSAGELAKLIPGMSPPPAGGDPNKTLAVNVGGQNFGSPPAGDPQKTLAVNVGGQNFGGPPPMSSPPSGPAQQKTMAVGVGPGGFGSPPPMAGPGGAAQQKTMAVGVPGAGGYGAPGGSAQQKTMAVGVPGAGGYGQQPAGGPAKTMMAQSFGGGPLPGQGGGGGGGGYNPGAGGMAPPTGNAAPGTPGYVAPPAMPEPLMQVEQPQYEQPQYQQPQYEQPQYQQPQQGGYAPQPQYLASQSMGGMSPSDPFAGPLRTVLVVFGIALLVTFAAPWVIRDGQVIFSFKLLTAEGVPFEQKMWPLLFGGTGLIAILFGLLPMASAVRALIALVVGISPIILLKTVGGPGEGHGGMGGMGDMFGGWKAWVFLAGMVLAPVGLLIRSKYTGAMLGRLLATVGCAALLALFLIPEGESGIPLIGLFKEIGQIQDAASAIGVIGGLAFVLVVVLGLITSWMPGSTSGGTGLWAWLIMLFIPAIGLLVMLLGGGASLLGQEPFRLYLLVDMLGWYALTSYGLGTLLGKAAEA